MRPWTPNLAGPFTLDPDAAAPAVDLDAWEITYDYRARHVPTGCEFRVEWSAAGQWEVWLKLTRLRRLPSPDGIEALARASVMAMLLMVSERAERSMCDAQNRADRVAPWG